MRQRFAPCFAMKNEILEHRGKSPALERRAILSRFRHLEGATRYFGGLQESEPEVRSGIRDGFERHPRGFALRNTDIASGSTKSYGNCNC
jgi:hypothetical protein